MASQNKAGQRNRARKSEKERAGGEVAATARSGAAGGRTSAARETAPHGRSLTINIPLDRAIDVAKMPVSAARRVLSGKRGGIPVSVAVEGTRLSGGHRLLISADGQRLETPPVEHLAFYLTLGIFAAAEVIEWPVALALTAGHLLTGLTRRPALREIGQGLETA